jgi:multiple sugar transport system permease protein
MAVTSTIENPGLVAPRRSASWTRLTGSDRLWALAFATPYVAVFLAFVIYPICYGLWLGSDPGTYRQLFTDPVYPSALRNTLIYLLVAVNLKLLLALMLSGFFMRKGWWTKAVMVIFILPWAVPAIPSYISIHWMLNSQWGLVNNVIWSLLQADGPPWLDNASLALGSVIYAHIWKWLPFWTLVFIAGRLAIPQEIYEAAAIDGAVGVRRFLHVVFPLLANIYVVCTLLATLWTVGDYTTVFLVSMGAPARSSDVLATLGMHYAFDAAQPELGVAAVMSTLPVLVPLALILMRRLHAGELQL